MLTNTSIEGRLGLRCKVALILATIAGLGSFLNASIVTSTTPGVVWSPITVNSFNQNSDFTISLFDAQSTQWATHTVFALSYKAEADDGMGTLVDQLNAGVPEMGIAAWRGATGSGDSGVRSLAFSESIAGDEFADWGSVSTADITAQPSFGNLALYVPSETTGGDPYFEGFFYDKSTPTYLGFRFKVEETDPDYRYGWLSITSVGANELTIGSWAFNDEYGEDLGAGTIPEPATVALYLGIFAMALVGYLHRSRR